MKILLFHPGGTAVFVQQTAKALYENGLLDKCFVTFAYCPSSFLGRTLKFLISLFKKNSDKELRRREITEIPSDKLVTRPWLEMLRVFCAKFAGPILADMIWEKTERDFVKFVAKKIHSEIDVVYGYEYASLEVFKRAKQLGIKTIYEMPAPFHRTTTEILNAEYKKFPQAITAYKKYSDKLTPVRNQRREEELVLSDIVVCNSDFTAKSLIEAGVDKNKIIKVPLGMPQIDEAIFDSPDSKKLVFLYVGTLSMRKGIHYLIEAWRKLNPPDHVELKIFGAVDVANYLLDNLPGRVLINNTVPKSDLYQEYQRANLLLFPSLCDGFGMALTESLANGCPVLTTPNAGASIFIKDYENGFVVAAGNADAILEKMSWCIENSEKLLNMRAKCIQTARQWQWKDYRKSLVQQIIMKLA